MDAAKLSKYGRTTREDRLRYYREQIEELTPPETDQDRSMIEIFEELMGYLGQTGEKD